MTHGWDLVLKIWAAILEYGPRGKELNHVATILASGLRFELAAIKESPEGGKTQEEEENE